MQIKKYFEVIRSARIMSSVVLDDVADWMNKELAENKHRHDTNVVHVDKKVSGDTEYSLIKTLEIAGEFSFEQVIIEDLKEKMKKGEGAARPEIPLAKKGPKLRAKVNKESKLPLETNEEPKTKEMLKLEKVSTF